MNKTKDLIFCSIFSCLIIVGTFIRIPVPVVPFTLQFLFTTLAGVLLGGRLGFMSVCGYIFIGLIGLPVFTEGGGLMYVLKPSFGYIIGFAAGSYVTGKIVHSVSDPSFRRLLIANLVGIAIVYIFGLIYYWFISRLWLGSSLTIGALLLYGLVLAIPGDLILCVVSSILGQRLLPVIRRL